VDKEWIHGRWAVAEPKRKDNSITTHLTHRETAADCLASAESILDKVHDFDNLDQAIAIAQVRALAGIGHALVDLAKDGLTTYNQ
jgi:hypothetical protein